MSPTTAVGMQIGAGLAIVVCMYALTLWVIQRDQLVVDTNKMAQPRQQVEIMSGYASGHSMADRIWSTNNMDAMNFLSLKRSFNRRGGAQFSYSFWMKIDDNSVGNVAGKTILLRGDKALYAWTKQVSSDPSFIPDNTKTFPFRDVMVKCPRIRFGDTYGDLVIELNTVEDPDARIEIKSRAEPSIDGIPSAPDFLPGDPTMRHNMVSLTKGRWAMYTFTFEDHIAINDFEDGIMVRFYLNDTLYQTNTLPSTLRQNYGDMFLFPTISSATADNSVSSRLAAALQTTEIKGSIGNINYFNFSLGIRDVINLHKLGYPMYPSKDMMTSGNEPLYLSEYNRLDVYNS